MMRGLQADRAVAEAAGGSAMPWGLVLPAARAKLAEADWLPDVSVRPLVYSYTLSVPLSTIQMA